MNGQKRRKVNRAKNGIALTPCDWRLVALHCTALHCGITLWLCIDSLWLALVSRSFSCESIKVRFCPTSLLLLARHLHWWTLMMLDIMNGYYEKKDQGPSPQCLHTRLRSSASQFMHSIGAYPHPLISLYELVQTGRMGPTFGNGSSDQMERGVG